MLQKRNLINHFLCICMTLMLFLLYAGVSISRSQTENTQETQLENIEFTYNPTGKRDPFYSKLLEPDKSEVPIKALFGLQKFELTELNLVGIVWGTLGIKAVIETPDGKSYLAAVGTPIGKNDGTVKSMTTEELFIQEFGKDYLGNTVEKVTVLKIKPNQEAQ